MADLTELARTIYIGVQETLRLNDEAMETAQVLCVAEEAGEFVGAYRRSQGLARRNGTLNELKAELADVVIAAYTAAHAIGFNLDDAVDEKAEKVLTRGWKETQTS